MRQGQRARILWDSKNSKRQTTQGVAAQRGRKLRLEPLESRQLLAVFNPLPGTPDGDPGSLRDAIVQANASDEADTIELLAGTYSLTQTGDGDLDLTDIDHKITITGAGAGSTIIDASVLGDRVFEIMSGVTAEFVGVTITGGNGEYLSGAGVMNEGTLTLRSSIVSGNSSTHRYGAGLYNAGTLSLLENTQVSGNTTGREGAGIYNTGTLSIQDAAIADNSGRDGVGIWSSGAVDVVDSAIFDNTSTGNGAGIWSSGTLNVSQSRISTNTTTGTGAGIYNTTGGIATITDSTLSGNTAHQGAGVLNAGQLNVNSVLISNNTASYGGGIAHTGGSLAVANSAFSENTAEFADAGAIYTGVVDATTVTGSTFSGNTAIRDGGAIAQTNQDAPLTVADCEFTGNVTSTRHGGAIMVRSGVISDSTFSNNSAPYGGAVYHFRNGNLDVSHCTFTENRTTEMHGGAISNDYYAPLTVSDTTIIGNEASFLGGGIFSYDAPVELSNVTVSGNSALKGGGLASYGMVTAVDCTISNNIATEDGGGVSIASGGSCSFINTVVSHNSAQNGGGMYGGALTLAECTVSNNTASSDGAGVWGSAELSVINSTISYNNSGGSGGGIYNRGAVVDFANNAIVDNTAITHGGGIFTLSSSVLAFKNSTISGNTAGQQGGGIYHWGYDTLGLTNLTITKNDAGSHGGGIYARNLNLANTIIAENISPTGPDGCGSSAITSLGHNLIGNSSDFTFTPATGDLVGTAASPIDPRLGPLWDNGGPTLTHVLLPGSPIVDAGDDTFATATDQRGEARIVDGDGDGTATIDIGAVEYAAHAPYVTDLTDTVAGPSLRAAIIAANATPGADAIVLGSGTFTLTIPGVGEDAAATGDLDITDHLVIVGAGADETIIDASALGDRVFDVKSGVTVELVGVTITGGETTGSGAGIYNRGNLSLKGVTVTENDGGFHAGGVSNQGDATLLVEDSVFSNNSAGGYHGGAIYGDATGDVTILDSVFSGNTAQRYGGAVSVASSTGILTVVGCQFSDNSTIENRGGAINTVGTGIVEDCVFTANAAAGAGGAIFSDGPLAITGSTFSANTAGGYGGAVHSNRMLTIADTVITGNTSSDQGGGLAVSGTSAATLTNTTVSGNSALSGGGGMSVSGTLTMMDSVVSGNHALNGGGAYSYYGALNFINSDISNNTASSGGGIYSRIALTLDGCAVSNNTADASGGGVVSGSEGVIINSTFIGNHANEGGGLYNRGDLQLDASTFNNNSAVVDGGGIYNRVYDSSVTTLSWADCTLSGNTAGDDGGGIYDIGLETLQLTNFAVSDNQANGLGGGMFTNGPTTLTDSVVSGNSATEHGGGVHGVSYAIINSAVSNNTADGYGGGLHATSDVTITGSTISGNTAGAYGGGVAGSLLNVITECDVSNNTATLSGGGIYSPGSASTLLTGSRIADNTALSTGGGVAAYWDVTVRGCDISGNTAGSDGGGVYTTREFSISDSNLTDNDSATRGGGIYNHANMALDRVTISNNTSATVGGGIYTRHNTWHDVHIANSTLSGNAAGTDGGGLYNQGYHTVDLTNATITANDAIGRGGGVYAPKLDFANTIIAKNTASDGPDGYGSFVITSLGHNLIGDSTSLVFTSAVGDQVGTAATPIDPMLAELADTGGPTQTHALLPGSPALDAGDDSLATVTDQRGFPRILDGDLDGTARIDIGAVEYCPDAFYVTSLLDVVDGVGELTLREAVIAANAQPGADVIVLTPDLFALTITGAHEDLAAAGDLDITDDLVIVGAGAHQTTIDASALTDRVFDVKAGATVGLHGVTITGGSGYLSGAGITNAGTLTLWNSRVTDNSSLNGMGGGIYNTGSLVLLENSRVSGNSATTNHGGGIWSSGVLTLDASEVSGNFGGHGAGIFSTGTLGVSNSDISNNTVTARNRWGGGIANLGTLTVDGSTIQNNRPTDDPDVARSDSASLSGGGIYNDADCTATVTNSTISHNAAGYGGAIYNKGDLLADGVTVSFNTGSGHGSGAGGVFNHTAALLSVANSTFANNSSLDGDGGAIFNWSATDGLTVTNSSFSENTAYRHGGAISTSLTDDLLTVIDCDFTENETLTGGGGAIATRHASVTNSTFADNAAAWGGGAINHGGSGSLEVRESSFAGNQAVGLHGGAILSSSTDSLTIADSTFSGNTADWSGGAIHTSNAKVQLTNLVLSGNSGDNGGALSVTGPAILDDCTLADNTADVSGGAVYATGEIAVSNSQVLRNTAGEIGGGISTYLDATIVSTTVSDNHAGTDGGGVYNTKELAISDSTVSSNVSGTRGGGIYSHGDMAIQGVTVSNNTATSHGGGIYNRPSGLDVEMISWANCTVSGNSTGALGGGIYNGNYETLQLTNFTITDNHADSAAGQGGGIYAGAIILANTILAANTSPDGPDGFGSSNITSLGHNLIGDNSDFTFAPGTGDLVGTLVSPIAPLLADLADNGGPTQTHALLPGSPAFDAGDNSLVAGIDFDQRGDGFPRIIDGNGDGVATVDIGAFESELLNRAPVAEDDAPIVNEDTPAVVDVLANDSDPDPGDTINVSSIETGGTIGLATLNPDGTIQYNANGQFEYLAVGETATDTFSYTITDSFGATDSALVTVTVEGVNDAPGVDAGPDQAADEGTPVVFAGSFSDVDSSNTHTAIWDFGDGTSATGKQWTADEGGNGHYYQLVVMPEGITWYDANDAAAAVGGHLATATSQGENDFLISFLTDEDAWARSPSVGSWMGPWLGGYQDHDAPDYSEPAGGWAWVTGEAWSYENWWVGPDDWTSAGQDHLQFRGSRDNAWFDEWIAGTGTGPAWNDKNATEADGFGLPVAYIVEFESVADVQTTHTYADNGAYTVTLTVTDNDGASTSDSLTVTVSNVAPIAMTDHIATDEDTLLTFNVLDNDTDAGTADVLSAVASTFTTSQGAVVTILADGTTTYNPNGQFEHLGSGESANDTFTYEVQDDDGASDQGTVVVTITGVNDAPVADSDSYLMYGDTLTVAAPGVLEGDTDAEDDPLSAVLVTPPTYDAAFVLNPDGSFTYTPDAGFGGVDSFAYMANDGLVDSLPVTVTIRHALYVTNTDDSGVGSLRWTIENANGHVNDPAGPDAIQFAIGTGLQTIQPLSPLPTISDPVFIDGASQPGFAGAPIIELDGSLSTSGAGLHITASGSTIRALIVNRFSGNGVQIEGSGAVGNVLIGNYLGVDSAGTTAVGNSLSGVTIASGASSNRIGTDGDGIDDEAERNIISGNVGHGVSILSIGSNNNIVAGNYIGTDASGTQPLGNGVGVNLAGGSSHTLIGTDGDGNADQAERNIISGNTVTAVLVSGVNNTVIAGNFIGLDCTGTEAVQNGRDGIRIIGGSSNTLVGTDGDDLADQDERNVISANGWMGVRISGAGSDSNVVAGNFIGTDVTGTVPFGNHQDGIRISTGARYNLVGSDSNDAAERNLISANTGSGVLITSTGSDQNTIAGNYIGTDISGTAAIGNGLDGVTLLGGASHNLIGSDSSAGTTPSNLISANSRGGVRIQATGTGNNVVAGNFIGTDVTGTLLIGNSGDGVFLNDAPSNRVEENIVSGNAGNGVHVSGYGAIGNVLLANSIHSNSGLGIELGDDGPTANDTGDADTGPNNVQNYPLLALAEPGAFTHVVGTLNSLPDITIRLEFFANTAADPSGYGEGERYLDTFDVTTDSSGDASFDAVLSAATVWGEFVTATATDPNGNTSEFSAVQIVNSKPVADDDAYLMYGDTLTVASPGVLGGDFDPDGDGLDAVLVTPPTFDASFDLNSDGSFNYTPGAGFGGVDSFTYVANDGLADSLSVTVTIRHALYVTNTNDSGEGSFRWTIEKANNHVNDPSEPDTIRFAIDTGLQTIQPLSALPTITDPVFIDGASQPGFVETPVIELDGSLTTSGDGLRITTSDSTIRGLVVNRFSGNGVLITGSAATDNVLIGNIIGLNADGTTAQGNALNGVLVENGASNNLIGTDGDGVDDTAERNVISGNVSDYYVRANINIVGVGTNGNVVAGNFIGTDITGMAAVVNGGRGVRVASGAASTRIGTDGSNDAYNASERNVISGHIAGSGIFMAGANDSIVAGNILGLDVSGAYSLGDQDQGVGMWNAVGNRIGTNNDGIADELERNIISGNKYGVVITDPTSTGNLVAGNFIGTDETGTVAVGNTLAGVGIINGAYDNTIGGANATERNLISGNFGPGVWITDYEIYLPANNNLIQGNYIGTDVTGTVALPNSEDGIQLDNVAYTLVEGNLISGNTGNGVWITDSGATDNVLTGNIIGLNADGTTALGNAINGVFVENGASNNRIGTDGDGIDDTAERNVISGNVSTGYVPANVNIVGVGTDGNVVAGNFIGTDITGTAAVANGARGVRIASGAAFTRIGTDGSDDSFNAHERNIISGHVAGSGIFMAGANNSIVAGNILGLDVSGSYSLGQQDQGVGMWNAVGNRIGTNSDGIADELERNIISGNQYGVVITDPTSTGNVVTGNFIGTDETGTVAVGNTMAGVGITNGAYDNTIGGAGVADRNVISGNTGPGVGVTDFEIYLPPDNNVIQGNYVGTDVTGTVALPNSEDGILLENVSSTLVQDNVVSGNAENGVHITGSGATENVIAGNLIGTDVTGDTAVGNDLDGVRISDGASHNLIGTDGDGNADEAEGNLISGNVLAGVRIVDLGSDSNVVAGNFIGLDISGTVALGNSEYGVRIAGSASNLIGTDGDGSADAAERNIISANGMDGIVMWASNNVVAGNYIGTDVTGTVAIGNARDGVRVGGSSTHNVIGTDGDTVADQAERNIISGNADNGVFVNASGNHDNVVAGNFIGTDVTGTQALGNTLNGIKIAGTANHTLIGTDGDGIADQAERNVISSNGLAGVRILDLGSDNNVVAGNYIGLDISGTVALGNGEHGVRIAGSAGNNLIGTDGDGSADAAERNIISANGMDGIVMWTSNNVVAGNYIGTDVTGTVAIGNARDGVRVGGSSTHNLIGTDGDTVADQAERNVISGNAENGVLVNASGNHDNVVAGNFIGTDVTGTQALGNILNGVKIAGTANHALIGTDGDGVADEAERNVISANGWDGVRIEDTGTEYNVIAGNYIGTDFTGTAPLGNAERGVRILDEAAYNLIGTEGDGVADNAERNIVAANKNGGITLWASYNVVSGNYIGTDVTGTAAMGNGYEGIIITGAGHHNLIGTDGDGIADQAEGNLISGNERDGIRIQGAGSDDNIVVGNTVGTDVTGIVALGNAGSGVRLNHVKSNLVGGNLVSGNLANGVQVTGSGAADNVLIGNTIGLNAAGTGALGNGGFGVLINGSASHNRVGTDGDGVNDEAERNVVSGNHSDGVNIAGIGTDWNTVAGNYIGTDITGTLALGNGDDGASVASGARWNVVGTNGDGCGDASEGNLISGNGVTGGPTFGSGVVIRYAGTDFNTVAGNLIGTDASGLNALPNQNGIWIAEGPAENDIGANVISGNAENGIRIDGAGTDLNVIAGNYVGLNATGTGVLANGGNGVLIENGANNNRIGTDGDGVDDESERNVISGNTLHGVQIYGAGSDNNVVAGNFIGTDVTGTVGIGNAWAGVDIAGGAQQNLVGTDGDGVADLAERNILSANGWDGVKIEDSGTDSNVVAGNYIGTDVTGTADLGNLWQGVLVWHGTGNRIGTDGNSLADEAERNIIAGNSSNGVLIALSATQTTVAGNYIGTDQSGSVGLGNDEAGILILESASNNCIGTNGDGQADVTERNVIAANGKHGVHIYGAGTNANVIAGNYIGTDASGLLPLGNAWAGVDIAGGAQQNLVGTNGDGIADQAERNILSANAWDGIKIEDPGTDNNVVAGNYIGTDANAGAVLGNVWSGILIWNGAQGNRIGSDFNGIGDGAESNLIAANGAAGVTLEGSDTLSNTIRGNSIHSNVGLGIDLGTDGPTANDPGDTDVGPNNLQNHPELQLVHAGANPRILGALDSTPDTTFTVDFYANPEPADPATDVEGARYLGSVVVTTDAGGLVMFDVTLLAAVDVGEVVTATATDADANTSEFSVSEKAGLPVEIDVKPCTDPNPVNVSSNGVIAVAIFTTDVFDAAMIDVTSVTFAGASVYQSALEDVDGDGDLDMVLHFRTQETELADIYARLLADDINEDGVLDSNHQVESVSLIGETLVDEYFKGLDEVDLFLSGRKLRDLLDELAENGMI